MDKNEIRKHLVHFEEECERRGCPILDLRVEEWVPGLVEDRFIVRFTADWRRDTNMYETHIMLRKILKESVSEEANRAVLGMVPEFSPDVMEEVRQKRLAARKKPVFVPN
ncbi:MAG: hypothetical protein LBQ50_10375 [Planctomycetaceae bacterium]|jgi:hypothetical protein|nr:hypothetical protein [Planctomycetaceae bacterium]